MPDQQLNPGNAATKQFKKWIRGRKENTSCASPDLVMRATNKQFGSAPVPPVATWQPTILSSKAASSPPTTLMSSPRLQLRAHPHPSVCSDGTAKARPYAVARSGQRVPVLACATPVGPRVCKASGRAGAGGTYSDGRGRHSRSGTWTLTTGTCRLRTAAPATARSPRPQRNTWALELALRPGPRRVAAVSGRHV